MFMHECIMRVAVLGPVVRSLVSANSWLRGIKTYRFPWYLMLVSANHASSNPGLLCMLFILMNFAYVWSLFQSFVTCKNKLSFFMKDSLDYQPKWFPL